TWIVTATSAIATLTFFWPVGGRVRNRTSPRCSNHHTPGLHRPGVFASLDGNGSAGTSDLLALLANWGPCP
ncbi:MAG: hypothetical protein V3T84_17180, partial [Phycisphaerales bacterium]